MTVPSQDNGLAQEPHQPAFASNRLAGLLDEAAARLEAANRARSEPIAVVGIGCRFPGGADSPDAYWRMLREGVDAVTEIPPGRWDMDAYFDADPDAAGKIYARHGGFLAGVDGFDARFFEIAPREAASMDPQQRLLLEVSWEALEHAGLSPAGLCGSNTGVFVGMTTNDYGSLLVREGAEALDAYFSTGNALNAGPGRIAHVLGLQGPCLAVDTACSSSLVAVHLACQSLRSGESDTALAGGVNLILAPEVSIAICRARMLASDGRCKTFDAAANGYARAEGCGVVVLKRWSDAQAAGDRVLALLRGSAVNQDGASGGFTVPNGRAQEALIRRALASARVEPAQIDYLEAHGTGTPLGDPIEIHAAAAVLGEGRTPEQPLLIGSVKTNIGHAEAAAGIAGLIKVVLSLQQGEIAPHLHLRVPNPHIAWAGLPLAVATERRTWPVRDRPRLAGVSAFGASGTNAHVVIQEAPASAPPTPAEPDRPLHLLALSARTPLALRELAVRYGAHLEAHPRDAWADVCFAANTGRAMLPVRAAIVAADAAQARAQLQTLCSGTSPLTCGDVPRIAFLFTGQGSQYAGMGRELYETQPTFRRAIERCAEILDPCLDTSLRRLLFAVDERLDQARYARPALFSLGFALAELWRSWGVRPAAVAGHGAGEYVAACVAGVFSLEDGVQLMLAEPGRAAAAVCFQPPQLPVVSTLTGTLATGEIASPAYWVEEPHGRAPESLAGSIETLARLGCNTFIEMGPAPMLRDIGRRCLHDRPALWLTSLQPGVGDWQSLMDSLGRLYEGGAAIDWQGFDRDHRRARLPVPTYPWQREPHWRPSVGGSRASGATPAAELADAELRYELVWRAQPLAAPRPADYWPSPRDLAAALQPRLIELAGECSDADYRDVLAQLERACIDYVADAWRQLGWTFAMGTRCRRADLAERLGVTDRHRRLLEHTALMLAEAGVLRSDGDAWESSASFVRPAPSEHVSALLAGCPAAAAECTLLDRCGLRLADVLRGRQDPLQLLFPDGDATTASSLYRDAPGARMMNGAMREAVLRALQVLPAERRLRVLEVGGGTGGTTSWLLDLLPAERTDYLFTDLSPRFTSAARAQFGQHPFVRYRVLDIESAPSVQGCADEAGFDLIIAANVLHATRDLAGSLQHLRQLAAPGALLLLIEGTAPIRAVDLTFGLTDGWWRFTDSTVRPGYPLIGAADWVSLLERNGFRDAAPLVLESQPWGVLARQALLLARASDGAPPPAALPHWLILSDSGGIGARLAAMHAARGGVSTLVRPGAGFECGSEREFSVAANQPDDYVRLVGALDPARPLEVVHLWALDEPALDPSMRDQAEPEIGRLACGSTLSLVQALLEAAPPLSLSRTWLVTRGAVGDVPRQAPSGLAQAGLWGLGRVIAAEHPELRATRVDLDPLASSAMCTQQLWDELAGGSIEDELRWRGGERQLSRLVRQAPAAASDPVRWHADASYLITGGLGGLGLLTARRMAERGARTLVLAGRHGADERTTRACREIEALGARVVIERADAGRAGDVERLIGRIAADLPPLRGIVHAAGVLDDGTLRQLDWPRFAQVMQAKAAGAWHLHRLTRSLELDFFVLYSSFTGVLGTAGQANHAAANAFLDALAWQRRALGLPALSLDWGAWSDVGAAAGRQIGERLKAHGGHALSPAQGLRLLEQCWHSAIPQVAVVPITWSRLDAWLLRRPLLAELAPATPTPTPGDADADVLSRLHAASPRRRLALLTEHVRAETARVLGVADADAVAPNEGFFALGMDSLTSVELRNRLRAGLGCELPTTVAFDHSNAAALAAFVLGLMDPALAPTPEAGRSSDLLDPAGLSVAELDQLIHELAVDPLAIDEAADPPR